jgi:multidrug efflux pump subunit AcrA (membrane-fusion protein)
MNSNIRATLYKIVTSLSLLASIAIVGCKNSKTDDGSNIAKAPRPVSVMTLIRSTPKSSYSASGIAKSWKTENIGFEVAGRVQWVLEPGENIDGRITDPDGNLVQPGTPLANIEPDRYQIAVESAEANLEVARLAKEGIAIQLSDSIPAELDAAAADLKLAEIEFDRMEGLNRQNAISRSEYDQAKNRVQQGQAAIQSLLANEKRSKAELKSAESQIRKAEQTLKDARRDLANTTLYASYQGQISEVNVVPGSVVSAGSPVLTLQMTNPIKVEVELSAKQSRVMRRRRSAPVVYKLPSGKPRKTNAIIYNMDASADPSTRTFTMTLLLLNEQFRDELPDSIEARTVARSADVWPVRLNYMMGTPDGVTLVEESAITRKDGAAFIHVITNAKLRETLPEIVKVRRQRIVENELRIPFLGNWVFRSISFIGDDGSPEDVDLDLMYVGKLEPIEGTLDNWDGESIVLDNGWLLD